MTEHIELSLRLRSLRRAELALQGERICAAFEFVRECTSEEERNLALSCVADEVAKFRKIQAS